MADDFDNWFRRWDEQVTKLDLDAFKKAMDDLRRVEDQRRSWTYDPTCDCPTCKVERERRMKKPDAGKYGALPLAVSMLLDEVAHIEKTTPLLPDLWVSSAVWSELALLCEQSWELPTGGKIKTEWAGLRKEVFYVEREDEEVFGVSEDPAQEEPVRLNE